MAKQSYEFPRVTTRGYYDQNDGTVINDNWYNTYPKRKVAKIFEGKEVVIFVHGMRNSRWGAIHGARLLRNRLRKIGYKYPVIAFTYDAEIRGAHIPERYSEVIGKAEKIARGNGIHNLSRLIGDIRTQNPSIKIRLVGHSLGCDVIKNIWIPVESIHLFGSPVEADRVLELPSKKTVNYLNPKDDVIRETFDKGLVRYPSCLSKITGTAKGGRKFVITRRCLAKDHRFKSYVEKVRCFP